MMEDVPLDTPMAIVPEPDPMPWKLPAFVKPINQDIPQSALSYLAAEGAFWLPEGKLRQALVDACFEFVTPYMPSLDRSEILGHVDVSVDHASDPPCQKTVGILLFQAILFAGSAVILHQNLSAWTKLTMKTSSWTAMCSSAWISHRNGTPGAHSIGGLGCSMISMLTLPLSTFSMPCCSCHSGTKTQMTARPLRIGLGLMCIMPSNLVFKKGPLLRIQVRVFTRDFGGAHTSGTHSYQWA